MITTATTEILIHNLSHSDLVLGINDCSFSLESDAVIARPKFSKFKMISELIYRVISDNTAVATSPCASRSGDNADNANAKIVATGFNIRNCDTKFDYTGALRFRHDDKNLLRKEDVKLNEDSTKCTIETAYFPLIAVLIPKWLKTIEELGRNANKRIVLVSGRGTPIDADARMSDNSTKYLGKLISKFILRCYPDIEVDLIHSNSNLFRYDENIVFVRETLLPAIDRQRDKLVELVEGRWKEYMRVSLSFADGSSARISAINASLKYYRPAYMHFWQLKTFWREKKIREDDIECHAFEEIATTSAIEPSNVNDEDVQMVLREMSQFRAEFAAIINNPNAEHDLAGFWLRKSKKPVLSVLLVKKKGGEPKLYRGTNMEVSMPTGSLCAERNVIGSALAADITLKRQDIQIVAVYSGSMNPVPQFAAPQPLSRQGSASATIEINADSAYVSPRPDTFRVPQINTNLDTIPDSSAATPRTDAPASAKSPSIAAANKRKVYVMSSVSSNISNISPSNQIKKGVSRDAMDLETGRGLPVPPDPSEAPTEPSTPISKKPRSGEGSANGKVDLDLNTTTSKTVSMAASALRRTSTRQQKRSIAFASPCEATATEELLRAYDSTASLKSAAGESSDEEDGAHVTFSTTCSSGVHMHVDGASSTVGSHYRTICRTISVDESDMNPLKPCGACNEWLKKIAEVNPRLRVITFTDAECKGIYIENVDHS